MDYALEKGVNFGTQPRCILFLHVRKPTDTERIIGTWFKKTGRREEVVLASKIVDLTLTLPICARRMTSPASINTL
jgi:aryl-alcohol dehydrogenase-like predicted oxidoreductase